jgi:hypothetical protein
MTTRTANASTINERPTVLIPAANTPTLLTDAEAAMVAAAGAGGGGVINLDKSSPHLWQ